MADEILTEICRIKEEFAARFNHDLDAMFRYLKNCERESGRNYVNLTKKPKRRRSSRAQGNSKVSGPLIKGSRRPATFS